MGRFFDRDRLKRVLPGICKDIKVACMPLHLAAVANGLPERTFERYWKRGKDVIAARADPEVPEDGETADQQLLADMAHQVYTAQACKVRSRLARIAQGLPGWQGSGWILERSPDTREAFAPPKRLEISGPGGGAVQVITSAVDDLDEMLSSGDKE